MDSETELGIEWDCQKLLRQYYHYVDQREYEKATALFTPDVDWEVMGLRVGSHEAMLEALQQSLGSDTIRHILTNAVVTVVDEDHATVKTYYTFYYTAGVRIEEQAEPLEFEGPHRRRLCRTGPHRRRLEDRQAALTVDLSAQSR